MKLSISDGGKGENFSSENKDCTVRTLVHFLDVTYEEAHKQLQRSGRKQGKSLQNLSSYRVLEDYQISL